MYNFYGEVDEEFEADGDVDKFKLGGGARGAKLGFAYRTVELNDAMQKRIRENDEVAQPGNDLIKLCVCTLTKSRASDGHTSTPSSSKPEEINSHFSETPPLMPSA